MIDLKDANKIMEKINHSYDIIRNKMYEFDKKRMHDSKAHLIYEGLRFAHIEMCELMEEVETVLSKQK